MRPAYALSFLLALAGVCCGAAPTPAAEVRRLEVLILVYTRSFAHTLTAPQVERLQEEIVEFADFYQTHGGDRVDFRFTLLQLDRQLRREEVSEVAPGRYYLSRENVAAELEALGMRGFDEVVAFYAWHNANPDAAVLAYGGGAVGPDGGFLGDAGFNSIGVFAWDPGRIAQIAVHEVLHNVDDMFSRSGMADAFFNSDEMSRNLPRLLEERPGAFLPFFTDREMLAYALREQAGKEMYPWWMQRIYYAWMLERTPAAAWNALRYGRMAEARSARTARALYDRAYVARATARLYLPVLDAAGQVAVSAGRSAVTASPRRYALEDFDGTPLVERDYHAAWVAVAGPDSVVPVRFRPGGVTTVHRLRLGDVQAPAHVVADTTPATLEVRVVEAGWPQPGAALAAALTLTLGGDTVYAAAASGVHRIPIPRGGSGRIRARAGSYLVPDAPVRIELRRPWSIHAAASLEANMASPAGLRVALRDDRALRAEVTAEIAGRRVPLERLPDGDYHAVLDSLPPGLHAVELHAARADGQSARDTVLVYARPAGWIRVPAAIEAAAGEPLALEASVHSRMGRPLRGLRLPLVALAGAQLVPLVEAAATGKYTAQLSLPPGQHRIFVTSLEGDFQRRVVIATVRGDGSVARAADPPAGAVLAGATGPLPYVAAVHAAAPPVLDGELGEWHGTPLRIGAGSPLLTGADSYRGADDASAELWFAWSDSALYVAGRVRDDDVTAGEAWDRDRVNLVFDWRENDTPLSYGTDGRADPADWQPDDAWVFFQPFWSAAGPGVPRRIDSGGTTALAGAQLASRRTPGGYEFELALPASALPEYAPFPGHVAALQVFLTDGDEGEAMTELMWSHRWGYSPDGGLAWELPRMGRLVFLEAAR